MIYIEVLIIMQLTMIFIIIILTCTISKPSLIEYSDLDYY